MKKLCLVAVLLVATNAFAAGRELAPRGAAPTSYATSKPQVAFAGTRFLTIWTEDMGNIGLHLMGAFSDASGHRVTTVAFPVLPSFAGHPLQLVGTGDGYAFFWKDGNGNTVLTDVDLAGNVTRTTTLALPRHIDLRVAWNGTRFFAALRHPVGATYDAEGFLLARSGEILRRDLPLDDQAYAFHVIADGDGFAAATSGFRGVFAYRIAGDGDVTSYAVDETPSDFPIVSTTSDGGLLVVRAAQLDVRANVVTASGEVQPRIVLAASTRPLRVVHVRRVDDGSLVAYLSQTGERGGLATLTLHANGTVAPSPDVAVDLVPNVLTPIVAASSASTTFTVFARPETYPPPLLSVSIANDGSARDPEPVAVSRTRQSQPILGSGGGRVLAAWSDIQGIAAFVRTTSLTPDAAPLTDTIAAPAYVAARELPWNGAEYLVVESRNDQLLATRVAYDGTPLDAAPLVLGSHFSPWWALNAAVAWAGDRWVVAWDTNGRIQFATVRNGVATPAKQIDFGEALPSKPALSFNGTALLLVWNQEIPPECYFPPCVRGDQYAYAARLTLDGTLDAKRLAIPTAYDYSIATSGNEFLILGGTTATTIDASASAVLDSRPIFNWPAAGDVTWGGTSYAVALRYLGVRWHLSVTHLDRDLNLVAPPRGTETLPPDLAAAPSIAGSIVAVQEGDPANGARAVVYRETDMPPLPAPPPPPHNMVKTLRGDGLLEVTWDESPGAELYRVTVTGPGTAQSFDVPADQPRRAITLPGLVRVTAFNAGGASDPLVRRRAVRR
jgi:hypothetical protein